MVIRSDVDGDLKGLRLENRALRLVLVLVGLAWLVHAESRVRAQGTPFKVEAHEFVLLDRDGERQAVLGFGSDGRPELVFFKPDGKRGVVISDRWQLQPAR